VSPTNRKSKAWLSWLAFVLLLATSLTIWYQRQWITDSLSYYQYHPTSSISNLTDQVGLTDQAKFVLYASQPEVQTSAQFNQHCTRKEANSPILGCYVGERIYIYNVTDTRLEGLKAVTMAHELLHAIYERMPKSEKDQLQPLLQAEYDRVADKALRERVAYYEKTEPGETMNELHSIIGTEYGSLSPALEAHYKKYFTKRESLVLLHNKVEKIFDDISEQADSVVNRIELLASKINTATKQYNADVEALNIEVTAFNQRAKVSGGFTTEAEFESARARLLAQTSALDSEKAQIQADILIYKSLIAQLDSINTQSAALNQSIDSKLSEVPSL
jgi:hypothetical protein